MIQRVFNYQCYEYILDESFDVRDTPTLDFIFKYHHEVRSFAYDTRPSSMSTHQRDIAKYLIIHAHYHHEKRGRVFLP